MALMTVYGIIGLGILLIVISTISGMLFDSTKPSPEPVLAYLSMWSCGIHWKAASHRMLKLLMIKSYW